MKKTFMMWIILAVLCSACGAEENTGTNNQDLSSQVSDHISLSAEHTVSEDHASENPVSEEEEPETVYMIDKDDIVNLEEAFKNWSDIDETQREITIEEGYVENDVPIELQDMMIYCHDGIDDERDEYIREYIVDCEEITEENMDNYPMEEIAWDVNDYQYTDFKIIDLDGDGENEYFHSVPNGNQGRSYLCFHKKVDDEWIDLTLYGPYILLFDGRYYVWSGNILSCWNNEVETVRSNVALIEEDNPCWNRVVLAQFPSEYTLYELYSNVQDDSIDFLENISLDCEEFEDYINNDIERVKVESSEISDNVWWETDRGTINPKYGWERSNNGEQYLYVVTKEFIESSYADSCDYQLVIMHQTQDGAWEIDKVYYLMKGFDRKLSSFVR